jgi:hypothetical protein
VGDMGGRFDGVSLMLSRLMRAEQSHAYSGLNHDCGFTQMSTLGVSQMSGVAPTAKASPATASRAKGGCHLADRTFGA